MINISYYARKRIKDYLIHFIMLSILAFTLFPIGWMIFTSLKENTDVLIGKIPFSHAHNNTINLKVDKKFLWVLTSDGGITKVDRKNLKELSHEKAKTMTTNYVVDSQHIWVSSGNHGLLRYDKNNLKSKKEYNIKLPYFDRAKIGGTSLVKNKNKIYFSMRYKGYEQIVEFDAVSEGVSRVFDIKNKFSPSQVTSLTVLGGILYVGLDKGLLSLDLKSGKIKEVFDLGEYLPLGVEMMKDYGANLVLAGNTGAYLFDTTSKKLLRSIYSSSVQAIDILDNVVYIGTNRGFIAYDLSTNKQLAAEMIFRQLGKDGTIIKDSSFTPAETLSFAYNNKILYVGSSYGRVSEYSLVANRVIDTFAARQGQIVISWVNYVDMWKNVDFGLYLKNSFIICGAATLFAMIFATMAAYALARFDFPGGKVLSMAILATQMVPGIMFLIPIYSNFVKFSEVTGVPIKGTYWGIIFVYSAFFIPFSIWILRGFFAAIPLELEEAARIDGCSPFQVFWHVVLPLAVPGIIATGIYVFLTAWDELIFAWVLTSGDTMTIPVGIRNFVGNYQNRFDLIMAAAVVATAPVMILFFMLQKYIVKGLTAGAIKG